jgi:parallel beta-helix repeat protein
MHGRRRLTAISLGILAAVMTTISPVSANSASTTRWVDNDGHAGARGCDSSARAFTHVQAAVDASDVNDVVVVCPGTYTEQIVITGDRAGLTLRSSKPFGATLKTPGVLVDTYLGTANLLFIDTVNRVTVQGFKMIVRTSGPCDDVDATILASGSRHTSIRGNRILAPGSGSGAACIQGVGVAIFDRVGHPASAVVGFNEVRDAVFVGIWALGAESTTATIVHNSVRAYFGKPPTGGSPVPGTGPGGQFAIGMFGRARGNITNNVIQGAGAAPLTSGSSTFIIGIAVVGLTGSPSTAFRNGPIDVHGNIVRRVLYGLYGVSADQLTIRDNVFRNAYIGLRFEGAEGNAVSQNTVATKYIGIQVDAASSGNQLRRNSLSGNGVSCQDDSVGSGTAGTANGWHANTAAQTSSPTGICGAP